MTAGLRLTGVCCCAQAAYQEVQAFAKYGGGYGAKSVAGFTTVNKGSSGDSAAGDIGSESAATIKSSAATVSLDDATGRATP